MMIFYKYTVVGKYQFPIDMLRYDCAYPFQGQDAAEIEHSFNPQKRADHPEPFRVTLIGAKEPTVGRWSSFLWSVDPETVTSFKR